MYVLYLDESGTHAEASYFVLAGLAVFEREIHWFADDLDRLQKEYFPQETDPVFFHASRLRGRGKEEVESPLGELATAKKLELKDRVYDVIRNRKGILFACAVEKRYASIRDEDPYERAFEDLIRRFDMFMRRANQALVADGKEEQRGLVVLAQSSYDKTLALLARHLRERGTRWGSLHNVTDIPLFAPARDTRLLQFADFCSNAVYGRYHSSLTGDFDRIAAKFDQDGGTVHGLVHLTTDAACSCIACFSRRSR